MACTLVLMSFFLFCAAQCVRISPAYTEILSKITAVEVILPCLYTTSNPNSVRIAWYKFHSGEDEPVMRVNTMGVVIAGHNFIDRVGKGFNASLILIMPKKNDSGIYKCVVSVTPDEPNSGFGIVILTVEDGQMEGSYGKCSANMPNQGVLITIITCIWLAPLISSVIIMSVGLHSLKSSAYWVKSGVTGLFPRKLFGVGILLLTTSTGLCAASIVCVVSYAMDRSQSQLTGLYQVGCSCGAAGIVLYIALVLEYLSSMRMYQPEKGDRAEYNAAEESVSLSVGNVRNPRRSLQTPSRSKVSNMITDRETNMYIGTEKKVYY